MATIEELQKENAELKEKNKALEKAMIGLRFASNTPDVEDAYKRREAALAVESPAVGTRVKVVHAGCKYNASDFASSFEDVKIEYTDTVENSAMGVILAKAEHFKKKDTEVFLVKFDTGKGAVLARKGFEPALWVGSHVTISNIGCKYAAKDFASQFSDYTVTDDCKLGQKGVIIESVPHYKAKNTTVHLVAIDASLRSIVMNGKGCMPKEVPGLRELTARKEREAKAAAAKAAAEKAAAEKAAKEAAEKAAKAEEKKEEGEEEEGEAAVGENDTEKRKADAPSEDAPDAKKSKDSE